MVHTLLVLTDTSHLFSLRFTYNTDSKKEDDISVSDDFVNFRLTNTFNFSIRRLAGRWK